MLDLQILFSIFALELGSNVSILTEIVKGVYRIGNGGVTMKNISRWTDAGCSYRTIQRFFGYSINWALLNILLFQSAYWQPGDKERYLLTVDEVVEDKAGKSTWGIDWFYSSIAAKVIRSISTHVVSLVDTERESSFVLHQEQTVKPVKKKETKAARKKRQKAKKKKAAAGKKKAGRPKGSKNKQNVKSTGLLYQSFESLLRVVLPMLRVFGMNIGYVVGDGAYGNKTCCIIAKELEVHLISKLNRNTALFLPFTGKYSGRGRKKKYGERIDYDNIPSEYRIGVSTEDGIRTDIYQIKGIWTRHIGALLNVVIIIKTDLVTQKQGRALLFSTDLELEGLKIVRFYSLRFQIEFNFRDAKQYFGMADFKNIKQTQVANAIGLSLFMDNVSLVLLERAEKEWEEENLSIQDLKAWFRGGKYLKEILNTLGIEEESILNHAGLDEIRKTGAINRKKKPSLTT